MSESEKQQQDRKAQQGGRSKSNPLAGSALFSSTEDVKSLPDLSEETSTRSSTQRSSAATSDEQQVLLLYNTPAPPEYILRAFEQRHDRQTIYVDARKAGALDALVKLVARGNKTDLYDEMVNDILAKHADVLQGNEEMVRILEDRYKKKHNL